MQCSRARDSKWWCGRGDSNPHRPCGPTDFLTSYGFRRPRPPREAEGTSLWSGLSLHRAPIEPEVRCCPSSLYTFLSGLAAPRAWLGIASQGFPEFGQFCFRSFPRSTQVASSPLRLPVSPRPRDGSFYIAAGHPRARAIWRATCASFRHLLPRSSVPQSPEQAAR